MRCAECGETGYSPEARRLADMWYGKVPFSPADRGSTPFTSTDVVVRAFAEKNVQHAPHYYGAGDMAIQREAQRLCELFNSQWMHHLSTDDVTALVAADRLRDLTHTFTAKDGWKQKNPLHVPSPREVNEWSIKGFGHDTINQHVCVSAACKRGGVSATCPTCDGEGDIWPSPEAKLAYEDWRPFEPPAGDGYQIWETVSEGSPISPVFSTAHDLAAHMATTRWGADQGTSFETWLKFIEGPGWAPSMISSPETGMVDGVTGVVTMRSTEQ